MDKLRVASEAPLFCPLQFRLELCCKNGKLSIEWILASRRGGRLVISSTTAFQLNFGARCALIVIVSQSCARPGGLYSSIIRVSIELLREFIYPGARIDELRAG